MSAKERPLLDSALIRWLRQFARPHAWLLFTGVALLVVGFVVDMANFYLVRLTIDGPVKAAVEVAEDQRQPHLDQAFRYSMWFLGLVVTFLLVPHRSSDSDAGGEQDEANEAGEADEDDVDKQD